jgi:uncharacterized protein (TIGR02246 family)
MKQLTLAALAASVAVAATPALASNHAKHAKPKGTPVVCAQATEAQVAQLFSAFDAAWATRDPDKVTDLFGADAVLLATVSNTPRTDRAGIRDYFVTFLKNAPRGTIDTSTYDIGCNMVSRVGTWTVNLTNPDTKAVTPVKARYTFIYKYENGRWVIDHLHSSMMPEKTS